MTGEAGGTGGQLEVRRVLVVGVMAGLLTTGAFTSVRGQQHSHSGSDTVPSEARTLTAGEVAGLRDGTGMGMALPAELNGYPGPRHVLDLADSLSLSSGQRRAVQDIFDRMSSRAQELGDRIIQMERELDGAFAAGAEPEALEKIVERTARLRGDLRWVHLRAHLATADILSRHQRHAYDRLRGHAP